MGLLADVFSAIDSKKRALRGLLDDPSATIDMAVNRAHEDYRNMVNTQATAYPWTSAKPQSNTPQQVSAAQQQLADMGANMGMAAATVWHGSPHKFDKFDASKIGTGEGAQAYGHGLYLAESPGTADWYRSKLTPGQYDVKNLGINGQKFKRLDFPSAINARDGYGSPTFTKKQQAVLDSLSTDELSVLGDIFYSGDVAKLRNRYSGNSSDSYGMVAGDQNRLKILDKLEPMLTQEKKGSLYKVDLPDEHIAKMLDWDKPLFEQPEKIQDMANLWGKTSQGTGDVFGSQFLKEAESRFGGSAGAADALRARGIPGIRYLDGGSRGAGGGTSNFVVFPGNEGLLNILERNGQPVNKLQELLK